jgi:biotin carboxyl carrier protein
MSDVIARHADRQISTGVGWELRFVDARRGIVQARDGERSVLLLVEGSGSEWFVTLRGRRIPISVRTWREEVLAEAEEVAAARGGPAELRATLPGLVVAVAVEPGSEVAAGQPLLTIEAMKMQNEVRATRAGRVSEVAVQPGVTVATGALLLRLE